MQDALFESHLKCLPLLQSKCAIFMPLAMTIC
jgi:hypothetical protein